MVLAVKDCSFSKACSISAKKVLNIMPRWRITISLPDLTECVTIIIKATDSSMCTHVFVLLKGQYYQAGNLLTSALLQITEIVEKYSPVVISRDGSHPERIIDNHHVLSKLKVSQYSHPLFLYCLGKCFFKFTYIP